MTFGEVKVAFARIAAPLVRKKLSENSKGDTNAEKKSSACKNGKQQQKKKK
jgi:hypothetical protein